MPVTVGVIVYAPGALAEAAVVVPDTVKASPFTAPLVVPVKAGLTAPYARDALDAVTVSMIGRTVWVKLVLEAAKMLSPA